MAHFRGVMGNNTDEKTMLVLMALDESASFSQSHTLRGVIRAVLIVQLFGRT